MQKKTAYVVNFFGNKGGLMGTRKNAIKCFTKAKTFNLFQIMYYIVPNILPDLKKIYMSKSLPHLD